jgi:hypothetical protein
MTLLCGNELRQECLGQQNVLAKRVDQEALHAEEGGAVVGEGR